ncbi:MAG: NAD-dependent epimerase/dehydratase family protein [Burkholderiales bacterium]|nr:NAD-dependent epimerase/dehydratase family protein [Burkholderiales bacterium]
MTDTVLVTGATGFLARHCIVALLEAGWRVRGSARSAAAADALRRSLRPGLSEAARQRLEGLSLVAADLTADAGWAEAVAGCRHVLHVASPFPAAPPRTDDELIVPAREGALRVLRAAAEAGVERVVLTSSIAAIISRMHDGRLFTEADWSDLDSPHAGAYDKSKHLAERAAWDFVAGLPPPQRLELVVINPGLLLGPLLGGALSTSPLVVHKLLNRDVPACPDVHFAIVDVRDVAAAHVAAMTHPQAAGERFICADQDVSMLDIARVLHEGFAARGFRVPTRKLPLLAMRLVALFDPAVRLALPYVGRPERVDSGKARRLLGWTTRPMRETILATGESLVAQGLVKPQRPPQPRAAGG